MRGSFAPARSGVAIRQLAANVRFPRSNVAIPNALKLVQPGVRLGSAIKELITIVHPRTFARWISQGKSGKKPRKRGRPRKPEEIHQLIIDMAKSTS